MRGQIWIGYIFLESQTGTGSRTAASIVNLRRDFHER
jgi:hypothetical protein